MAILSTPLQYLTSIPLATRILAGLLFFFSLLQAYLHYSIYTPEPYLTLLPGAFLRRPWTFVTAIFVEKNPLVWLLNFLYITLSFRYLERLWGAAEVFKFVLITGVLSNIIACVVNWLESFVLGMPEVFLVGQEYYGMSAVATGVLVAFTQLIPEHQVQLFGVIRVRVKRLPMLYVTVSTVLCLIGYQDPWIIIQFGWLVSWVYLRFYKKTSSESGTDTYGDRSETFAFVYWLPPFLHQPLGIVFEVVHNTALKLHIIPSVPVGNDLEAGVAPGGARAEAERRRAMALKALDHARVQKASSNGTPEPAAAASSSTSAPEELTEESDVKGKGKAPASADS